MSDASTTPLMPIPFGLNRRLSFAAKRRIVLARREAQRMRDAGYVFHETDWEIVRGGKWDWRIVDAAIDSGGKGVWTKIGPPDTPSGA